MNFSSLPVIGRLCGSFVPFQALDRGMEELLRTNNPVTISFVQSLLNDEGIMHFVADQHMSILEGSVGILAKRVMVGTDEIHNARRLLKENGLGDELPEKLVRPV
ncbi:DUF2007 domain-containing protein [Pseudahrensia aquimaris]|uniref:DUF2007 domain-containing protein n=1 Tax=Pseudahrensia aquimaris TaxID=744461 RepID=A0ABW3FDJ9_9HYPH